MSDESIELEGLPEETPRKTAVVRAYDPKLAERILVRVSDGATLREIASEDGMPTKSTIQRWIMKYPDLALAWKAAREMSASSLEDEALDMARTLRSKASAEFTGTRVRAFEVAMNQFRWSASHRDPAQFGQTATPNIVVPIQINTSLDLGQGGVKSELSRNTYEVASVINKAYTDGSDATVEGTDIEVEQGASAQPREADLLPDAEPKPLSFAAKPRGRPLGSRKGHKPPNRTKMTITRNAKKGLPK